MCILLTLVPIRSYVLIVGGSLSNELSDELSNKSSNKSLDPISLAHVAVQAIWGSGMCWDAFEEIIESGNARG